MSYFIPGEEGKVLERIRISSSGYRTFFTRVLNPVRSGFRESESLTDLVRQTFHATFNEPIYRIKFSFRHYAKLCATSEKKNPIESSHAKESVSWYFFHRPRRIKVKYFPIQL